MPASPPVMPGAELSHDWNAWANRYVIAARYNPDSRRVS